MPDNRLLDNATTQYDGQIDILAAAEDLAERIPDALAPLARVAYNYRWSWLPGGPELFRSVDSQRFELCMRNPVRLLQESPARVLRRAAHDRDLVARAQAIETEIAADVDRPYGAPGVDPARPAAFLCAEYGVHVSLPIYSGGLGALVVDLSDFGARNHVMADRVHPTAFGQIAIAERALAVLAADGLVAPVSPASLISYRTTRVGRLRGDMAYVYRDAKLRARGAVVRWRLRRSGAG